MAKIIEIKGSCENCGFAYKGKMELRGAIFTRIKCPKCKKETMNFDEAEDIDRQDLAEGLEGTAYVESEFEYINYIPRSRIKSLMNKNNGK